MTGWLRQGIAAALTLGSSLALAAGDAPRWQALF